MLLDPEPLDLDELPRDEYLNQACRAPDITPGEFRVLHALTCFADYKTLGNCFPGLRKVAEGCGSSRDVVRRHVLRLEQKGWIRRHPLCRSEGGRQTANFYQFLVPPGENRHPLNGPIKTSKLRGREFAKSELPQAGGKSAGFWK